jgi:putative oxidoreductase
MSAATTLSATWEPRVLSILRCMTGLLFLEHGTAKLFGFPHDARFDHLQLLSLSGCAGCIEVIGGLLVALGLFTRAAAFICSGEMAVGYFMVHAPRSFFPLLNGGDAAILYCFIFFYLFVAGGGVWSLDRMIWPTAAGGYAKRWA